MTDDDILTDILRREGGFVFTSFDRGAATNMGITQRTLSDWRGRDVTIQDVRELTEREAREIYRARYVTPFDGIDAEIKSQVVDIAVNSGVLRARTLLALAESNRGLRSLNTQLAIERLKFYARIVKADTSQAKFLLGWCNRACEFLT